MIAIFNNMFMLVGKIVSMALILIFNLYIAFYPINNQNFSFNKHILIVAQAFSSGIFFSISLINLLPDASLQISNQFQNKSQEIKEFPWAYLTALLSYSLMIIIDRIVLQIPSHKNEQQLQEKQQQIQNIEQHLLKMQGKDENGQKNNDQSYQTSQIYQESEYNYGKASDISQSFDKKNNYYESFQKNLGPGQNSNVKKDSFNVFSDKNRTQSRDSNHYVLPIKSSFGESVQLNQHKYYNNLNSNENNQASTSLIGQLIQLLIRSLFHGFALGMEKNIPCFIYIFLTIMLCKWYESLKFTREIMNHNTKKSKQQQYIILYSIITPLCVGFSWFISSLGSAQQGFAQAFVAGGFIYIATSDLLIEVFCYEQQVYQSRKLIMYLFAIGIVTSLWFAERKIQTYLG